MGRCEKLLAKARRNPAGLSFAEASRLAECHGFELARCRGSHHIFKRPGDRHLLNLQSEHGEAKPYQVRQLLRAIDEGEDRR